MASITTDAPSGLMARRLLAAAMLVPLFVVAMIVMLSIAIWRAAVAFGRSDVELRRVQQEREDLLVRERAARETAERADRAKDEFIAALSHELRTPLNAILGWMYMLQQDRMPESSRGKATDAVLRNAGVLSRLIEDPLDTSRITTGHLVLSANPVHLNAVVQAAVESVIPIASAKGVDVVLALAPGEGVVVGDAQRLQQVVWNLLSNAIKFSPRDRKVHVHAQTDGDAVIVSVADQRGGDRARVPAARVRAPAAGRRLDDARAGRAGPRPVHREAPHDAARRHARSAQRWSRPRCGVYRETPRRSRESAACNRRPR